MTNPSYIVIATPVTIAVGAILGVLVSISSVGAGALGVAALFFLYPQTCRQCASSAPTSPMPCR
jgi:hypothetical protein